MSKVIEKPQLSFTEALKEGERVKVSVVKIDPDRNRISLSFRDAAADPWTLLRDLY